MMSRDEALAICETLLGQVKAAGAEDAIVSVQSTQASHARFADNRITTSGRSENVTMTATVWVGQRRGAATGNDTSPAALKQLADEAAQIARLSPVHREYVPTLGAVTYAAERSFSAATERRRSRCAREGAVRGAGRVPAREGDRRRLPQRHRVGHRHGDRQRQSPLLPRERGQPERDGAQRRRHRLGPLRRRSLRPRPPRRREDRPRSGEQGRAVAKPAADRAGRVPGDPRAAGRGRPDGLPDRRLRRADRGRRPERVFGEGRQDARGRAAVQRTAESLQRPDAPGDAGHAGHRRGRSGDPPVAREGRRGRTSRVAALLGRSSRSARRRQVR